MNTNMISMTTDRFFHEKPLASASKLFPNWMKAFIAMGYLLKDISRPDSKFDKRENRLGPEMQVHYSLRKNSLFVAKNRDSPKQQAPPFSLYLGVN